jgi:hypothetical protein
MGLTDTVGAASPASPDVNHVASNHAAYVKPAADTDEEESSLEAAKQSVQGLRALIAAGVVHRQVSRKIQHNNAAAAVCDLKELHILPHCLCPLTGCVPLLPVSPYCPCPLFVCA